MPFRKGDLKSRSKSKNLGIEFSHKEQEHPVGITEIKNFDANHTFEWFNGFDSNMQISIIVQFQWMWQAVDFSTMKI